MAYMRKSTEAEIHRVVKNAIGELTRLGGEIETLSNENERLRRENEQLRSHEKVMRTLLRNSILVSARYRQRIAELNADAQKIEVEFHGEPVEGHSKLLFPRYTIDDDCTDYGWRVVVDASQGGIHAAMFYTMEHAQEWVENHQEWLDSEPGVD
jgi:hypothetical protein